MRLVDYFVEVVADAVAQQHKCEHDGRRLETRLPVTDYEDFALPEGVPLFCIPESKMVAKMAAYERKPTFFSFVLTGGDGVRAYGFALHYFEQHGRASVGEADLEWRPRVLCLISHHPFFSLFKEIVSWMYRCRHHRTEDSVVQTKIVRACEEYSWLLPPRYVQYATLSQHSCSSNSREAFVQNLDVRFGWKGGQYNDTSAIREKQYRALPKLLQYTSDSLKGKTLHVRVHKQDLVCYHVQRGNAVHLDDYCFQMLFQCLSLKNVIYIVNCLLLEQRVLVHSSFQGLLTPICEALCALLFPFCWKHVYIPFLPVKLIEYLQAPVPYFIGLHTSSLATQVGAEMFASCVVVHLDKDKVVSPISSRVEDSFVEWVLPRLPATEVAAVLDLLENVVPSPIGHISPHLHPTPECHRSASDAVNEVELTFGEGPLGITFESTHLRLLAASNFDSKRQLGGSAVVKSLPRLLNGLAGPAENSGLVSAGSYLIGINGHSTLDLTFEETINYLQCASRPIRLRFLNAALPYKNACSFADRLQALSPVSAMQTTSENYSLSWVDKLRGVFAAMFASICRDYQRFVNSHGQEPDTFIDDRQHALPTGEDYDRIRRCSSAPSSFTQFDHKSFCDAVPSNRRFLLEFTQTQCFANFLNESIFDMQAIAGSTSYAFFHECIHLIRESSNAREAIVLLFGRDGSPTETAVIDLS
uniref:UDENN domain-containing protein n=1 Tax=Peronospora matthiolae TaxID=2874970 RepID=A0AAV1V9F9_9STRA